MPQNETKVKMVIYSTDPTVDLTKSLPRPLERIREGTTTVYHTRVVAEARRWWYSVKLDEGLLRHNNSSFPPFQYNTFL